MIDMYTKLLTLKFYANYSHCHIFLFLPRLLITGVECKKVSLDIMPMAIIMSDNLINLLIIIMLYRRMKNNWCIGNVMKNGFEIRDKGGGIREGVWTHGGGGGGGE